MGIFQVGLLIKAVNNLAYKQKNTRLLRGN